jgi:hypothetical protein
LRSHHPSVWAALWKKHSPTLLEDGIAAAAASAAVAVRFSTEQLFNAHRLGALFLVRGCRPMGRAIHKPTIMSKCSSSATQLDYLLSAYFGDKI